MMHVKLWIILILSLLFFQKTIGTSEADLLSYIGSTQIKIDNDLILVNPIAVTGNSEYVVWVESRGIKIFTHDGDHIKTIENIGSGPGEFRNITNATVKNDMLYIFVDSQKKMILFSLENLEFVYEIKLRVPDSFMFSVGENGNMVFLHTFFSHNPSHWMSSFSIFSPTGENIGEYGRAPIYAALNRNMRGGGITIDSKGNVYYGYTGEPILYRYSASDDSIKELPNRTNYFEEAAPNVIREVIGDSNKLIRHAFSVSRPASMHYHNGYIFQVLQNKHPFYGSPTENYLEIWNDEGKKLVSEFAINSSFVFFDGEYLYSLANNRNRYFEGEYSELEFIRKYKIGG